jgi:hypothetical protein
MARRPLPEELKLWGQVTATVRPHPEKVVRSVVTADAPLRLDPKDAPKPRVLPKGPLDPIEPNRRRRIVVQAKGDPLRRIDLHGMTQSAARQEGVGEVHDAVTLSVDAVKAAGATSDIRFDRVAAIKAAIADYEQKQNKAST